ncbi:hypothetical protein NM208_g10329 [Fusarium decemcellulare]|uniref:Uncharacterized protein n=1 Tax=Fusarium decemcellulare TaxID=57161 RepID=A0ACC1RY93_9HYPO|nr:hypothetical protein NM208_g10329 [Fusarium decemcellulare]
MALRLSTRISIRWGDETPSEPTDTVVLSVGSYFMDLRVKKADGSIDWAFAGIREIVSQEPLHCRWRHLIDSRLSFEPDEGKFQKLLNGDDLETGSMPCTEKDNKVTPYEEVWRELQPKHGMERGWILQGQSGDANIFLGQFGGVYLAMLQEKDGSFSALREDLENFQGRLQWEKKYRSGKATLPSLKKTDTVFVPGEENWKVEAEVMIDGQVYHVRALQTCASKNSTGVARTARW